MFLSALWISSPLPLPTSAAWGLCPASTFSIAQCHSWTSWRVEQEGDCSSQPLHGLTPPQSQPHKPREGEGELAGCIAAKTRHTEHTSRGKASPNRYLMCTSHMVGSTVGTGLVKQSQGPVAYCVLSSPEPWAPEACVPRHNYVVDSLCTAVTVWISWWPRASTCQIWEESAMLAFETNPSAYWITYPIGYTEEDFTVRVG